MKELSELSQVDPSTGVVPRMTITCHLVLRGILSSVIGGASWSAAWVGSDRLLRWAVGTNFLFLGAAVLGALCAALVTGASVGLVLRRIVDCSIATRFIVAIICTVLAIAVGEFLYVLRMVYAESGAISLPIAFRVLIRFWAELQWYYLVARLAASFSAVSLALVVIQISSHAHSNLTFRKG
jgi:hypothetical protein